MSLLARRHWIFDLDGTLTVPQHDFDAIRDSLGLTPGLPILEQLAAMAPEEAAPLREQLIDIEEGLAHRAEPAPGAHAVVAMLRERGCRLAILTRNNRRLAHIALTALGLIDAFDETVIFGRDEAEPKPSPDGVQRILRIWGADGADAVMVGDFVFDLQAGRRAGAATVLVDVHGRGAEWSEWFDLRVGSLPELLPG